MHFMFNTETGFQDKEHTCSADRNLGAMLLSINSHQNLLGRASFHKP